MKITKDITYVGVDDHALDLFEGQYVVPRGMAYNSYLIKGEKYAVMDSVDRNFVSSWLKIIEKKCKDKNPDYLIVQHMESDHSSGIVEFMKKYPKAKIVSSSKAFTMMNNFFEKDYEKRRIIVKEGDTLDLGAGHVLSFISAPMVHWPEVIVTYDEKDKVLFSADGFGKFGANDTEDPEGWDCEARRYYIGIVGKYGFAVQNLLKKASGLDIKTICPLHGPVLESPLDHYLKQYDTWSSYTPEDEGVCVCYTSVYGHTKEFTLELVKMLEKKGKKVEVFDLARDDMAEAVEGAFRYSSLVLATTTYNNDIFPFMREFINHLVERNYQKRKVAIIENGSWAPNARNVMKEMLSKSKELEYCSTEITLNSAPHKEEYDKLKELLKEL